MRSGKTFPHIESRMTNLPAELGWIQWKPAPQPSVAPRASEQIFTKPPSLCCQVYTILLHRALQARIALREPESSSPLRATQAWRALRSRLVYTILALIFGTLSDLHSKLFGQRWKIFPDLASNVCNISMTCAYCHLSSIFNWYFW